jgi:hypothetical protein
VKLVNESLLEFKQGGDPFEKMGIGSYRDPGVGDRYKCLKTIVWNGDNYVADWYPGSTESDDRFIKSNIYTIIKINKWTSKFATDSVTYKMDDSIDLNEKELKDFFVRI